MKLLRIALFLVLPLTAFAQTDEEIWDPFEPVNRGIFWFNDKVDRHVLEPVAEGYKDTVPDSVERSVGNFFDNLRFPVLLVSDLIQLKFGQAATHTGRFLVNSTVGVVGLFDVASDWGMEKKDEDIASALAYRDIPPGPYIVLPFIGPSTLRETIGFVADTVLNPLYWLGTTQMDDDAVFATQTGLTALKVVDTRAGLIDAINTARESSVDYYLFTQGAFYQYRRGLISDDNPGEGIDDVHSLKDD